MAASFEIKPEVVKAIRSMFIDGATPSQLFRVINENHTPSQYGRCLIGSWFEKAFGVSFLRYIKHAESYSPPKLDDYHFNRDVIPEIVSRIDEWNEQSLEGTWLEGFSIKLFRTMRHEYQQRNPNPEWDGLTEKQLAQVNNLAAHRDYLWYVTKLLARLTERLQQKVVEQQAKFDKAPSE
ncbi:MAG: hypothetical protein KDA84_14490 [Planctomycetaceae bacterium]|nr:hypothetical protein [Planctomycetaceae bacterium]